MFAVRPLSLAKLSSPTAYGSDLRQCPAFAQASWDWQAEDGPLFTIAGDVGPQAHRHRRGPARLRMLEPPSLVSPDEPFR